MNRQVLDAVLKCEIGNSIESYEVVEGCVNVTYLNGFKGIGQVGNNQSKLVINTSNCKITYYKDINKGHCKEWVVN